MNHFKSAGIRKVKLAVPLIWGVSLAQTGVHEPMLFDFSSTKMSERWQSVNDGVMGGISKGQHRITGYGTMEFSGELSLENNGGFASIRTREQSRDLEEFEGLAARILGDGRRYYFTIKTDFPIFAGSYWLGFETSPGKWTEVRLPFKDFMATSFGRPLAGAPSLNRREIRSIGFLLADKKAGPFNLEIDWIKAYRQSEKYVTVTPTVGKE